MKKIKKECVACGLTCAGEDCDCKNVETYYCDSCYKETPLYLFDRQELCIDCVEAQLNPIFGSHRKHKAEEAF